MSPEQCEDLLRALKARFETYLDQCVNAYFNAEAAEIRKVTQRNSKDTAVERITSRWPHTLATPSPTDLRPRRQRVLKRPYFDKKPSLFLFALQSTIQLSLATRVWFDSLFSLERPAFLDRLAILCARV